MSREKTECCSYGGLMWLANRSLAKAVVQRRIAESPLDYVTYCAMCRDLFAAQGKRSLHLLDLLLEADPESRAMRAGPGYSQRHENRARLKRKLIKEVWGEEMPGENDDKITLNIPAEVQSRMEERLILVEDIQQVIAHAESTGKKLRNPQNGPFPGLPSSGQRNVLGGVFPFAERGLGLPSTMLIVIGCSSKKARSYDRNNKAGASGTIGCVPAAELP